MRSILLFAALVIATVSVACSGCRHDYPPPTNPNASADASVTNTNTDTNDTVTSPAKRLAHDLMGGHGRGGSDGKLKISPTACTNVVPIDANYGEVVNVFLTYADGQISNGTTCSDVLLNSRVVLTAGHCVTGDLGGTPPPDPPSQYTITFPNLKGSPPPITFPAVNPMAAFYQTTTVAGAITTSSGHNGFAAVVYNHIPPPPQVFDLIYPGRCSGDNTILCSPDTPSNLPNNQLCVKGDKNPNDGVACCSNFNAGTCNLQNDIGVLILPAGSLSQYPCVNVATTNANGSSVMTTGRMKGQFGPSSPVFSCRTGNYLDLNGNKCNSDGTSSPASFCAPVTTSCAMSNPARCTGTYPLQTWAVGFPPIDFCPNPVGKISPNGNCQPQCDIIDFNGFYSNTYSICSDVNTGGDSGSGIFLAGSHTVSSTVIGGQPGPVGPGITSRLDLAVDTATQGNWVQEIVNSFRENSGCYKESVSATTF